MSVKSSISSLVRISYNCLLLSYYTHKGEVKVLFQVRVSLTGFRVCNYKGQQQEDLLPQSVHNTFQHVHLHLRRSITQT